MTAVFSSLINHVCCFPPEQLLHETETVPTSMAVLVENNTSVKEANKEVTIRDIAKNIITVSYLAARSNPNPRVSQICSKTTKGEGLGWGGGGAGISTCAFADVY